MANIPIIRRKHIINNCILLFALILTLVPFQSAFAAGNVWAGAGSMSAKRYAHTATLLANGKVLIAGGHSTVGVLKTAELYDPTLKTWTVIASMITARESHTATLLSNGKVLVVGGRNEDGLELSSAELYDPSNGTWSSAGTLSIGRVEHTATLLSDNDVLVVGGSNGGVSLNSAELYNLSTGWSLTGSMTDFRDRHTASLITSTGKVLVAGGESSSRAASANSGNGINPMPVITNCEAPLNLDSIECASDGSNWGLFDPLINIQGTTILYSAELYDPVLKTWALTNPMSGNRQYHIAAYLPTPVDKVLVAGGFGTGGRLATAELYDPTSGNWSDTGSLHAGRYFHTATLLQDGSLMVTGGYSVPTNSVEIFNSTLGSWTTSTELNESRGRHTATLLNNHKVLVTGGHSGSEELSSAELFGPGFDISGNAGVASAKLSFSDGIAKSVVANASGLYSLRVSSGWSGLVTVSKTGVPSFRPANISYSNVTADMSGKNYLPNSLFVVYSNPTQDGYILESAETSGVGGTMNSAGASIMLGDDAKKRQYRSILSFDTTLLPNTAKIVSATLKIKKLSSAGASPFSFSSNLLYMDIRKSFFGTVLGLQLIDFAAVPGLSAAGTISATPVSGYYVGKLSTAGLALVNTTGFTQMRLRYKLDDNNNLAADWISFYSGNSSVIANKPVLEIIYYVP